MRSFLVAALVVVAGCGHKESKPDTSSNAPTPPTVVADAAVAQQPAPPPVDAAAPAPVQAKQAEPDPAPPDGYDFTPIARELLAVAACGDGAVPDDYPRELVASHCETIKTTQQVYVDSWLKLAKPWFAEKVPANLPKKVVYPFAGGDLSTALTVYPDADEITTMSLEPAGDPRTLDALARGAPAPDVAKKPTKAALPAKPKASGMLGKALGTIESELEFLYHVNFSNTKNMIEAMRGGALPTQLVFGLSALKVHGYEVVSLRYFKLDNDGAIKYLSEADVKKAPPVTTGADVRNRIFANAELRFRKPGGRVQIYRHIQVNLDEDHLKKDPRVLRHLEAKGEVAAMTKAASYLLSWDSFKTIRGYLLKHAVWMVSDCTGVAPQWGTPGGFEYETYGQFVGSHMPAGNSIAKNWIAEFSAQPKRELPFRFGYYDKEKKNTLVIMRRKKS